MIKLKRPQWTVFQCSSRFRVVVAGRRFGKTTLAIPELLRGACRVGNVSWYIAPTYRQAKQIAWERIKKEMAPITVHKNETDMSLLLTTGGQIALRGADNYDSLRGPGLDFVVFDEAANINPKCWTEVIRPALADREGCALFIGTPKGFNYLYEFYSDAATKPGWDRFTYTTLDGGNVTAAELETAKAEMDAKTFRQEFEGSFENTTEGKVYYSFDRTDNVSAGLWFDPALPVLWTLDFNVSPMSSLICQMHDSAPHAIYSDQSTKQLWVLDEISLNDSNIPEACREFIRRTGELTRQPLEVQLHGDAAGNARSHAGKSDWDTVMDQFRQHGNYRVTRHMPAANPLVADRVAVMNGALLNAAGQRRVMIHPQCKELIRDLEQVTWKQTSTGGTTGEIDKSDPKRTHSSDALSYLTYRKFKPSQAGYY